MGLKNSSNMFVGFKSLKTLSLKAVKVDDEAIEYILSNCPLLERLSLHFIFALKKFKSCWAISLVEALRGGEMLQS